jgi:hypothetical protein
VWLSIRMDDKAERGWLNRGNGCLVDGGVAR